MKCAISTLVKRPSTTFYLAKAALLSVRRIQQSFSVLLPVITQESIPPAPDRLGELQSRLETISGQLEQEATNASRLKVGVFMFLLFILHLCFSQSHVFLLTHWHHYFVLTAELISRAALFFFQSLEQTLCVLCSLLFSILTSAPFERIFSLPTYCLEFENPGVSLSLLDIYFFSYFTYMEFQQHKKNYLSPEFIEF